MTSQLVPWLVAFVFTQAFEVPIYLRATGSWRVSFLASAITHPFVWFVFPGLMDLGLGYGPMVALAEAFAVLAEAAWLHHNRVQRALLWSFVANAASAVGGLLLRHVFGVP